MDRRKYGDKMPGKDTREPGGIMPGVGLIAHPDFSQHETGPGHPERPERLHAIQRRLDETGLQGRLFDIAPRMLETDWLEKVHTSRHIADVQRRCEQNMRLMDAADTFICPASFNVGRLAAGAACEAVDAVMNNRADAVFCATRPPGHHAERDTAMGFCLFNNVAVAARYIQSAHRLERILIVDWDVHHGNGTQHIFEEDPTVFYFSTHQYPHYPWFSGSSGEMGIGAGKGTNLNAPLPAGAGDEQYLRAFDELLAPAMERFRPEFVIVSAGFDAHVNDPLSATQVTEEGFAEMTRRARKIARIYANDRLISVLEGGYDLNGLARCVEYHLSALLENGK